MASPSHRSADERRPLSLWRKLYQALASLELAVLVIAASAAVLGWATLVESRYGTQAVHFGIYGTWWFAALNVLLGLNVLAAALIRLPWKRYQTGFVVTHAGILVLLVGALISRLGGIDAQLPVFEGRSGHLAFEDTQHFELTVFDAATSGRRSPGDSPPTGSENGGGVSKRTIEIPFSAGPFNWREFARLSWFPWRLAKRDMGVLYDHDGIQLKVLDYLSNSTYTDAGLKLRVQSGESDAEMVDLRVRGIAGADSPEDRMGLGSRQDLPGGQRIVFWIAGSRPQTEAFLKGNPREPLGAKGVLVLYAGGKRHEISLDRIEANQPVPLGDTGMKVELVELDARFLAAVLKIHHPGETSQRMVLFADVPEFSQHDREHGVYGTYWVDPDKLAETVPPDSGDPKMLEAARQPRIDILQSSDSKLYYRTWLSPQVGEVHEVPNGEWTVFESTGNPLTLALEQYTPGDQSGRRVVAGPFLKQDGTQTRQARVRLTVDGQSEDFWLEGIPADPLGQAPQPEQRKVVVGDNRRVAVTLAWDQIDIGFRLFLHKFERKLDPGTSQASWYSSLVDLVDRDNPDKVLQQSVLITLNEPVNFSDPQTGRSYRVYQEAFRGPFKPGDPLFDRIVAGQSQRNELFLSWLTINYDPGRGLKYFGSLLIVAGIGTMFYMRAYFFRRREDGPQDGD